MDAWLRRLANRPPSLLRTDVFRLVRALDHSISVELSLHHVDACKPIAITFAANSPQDPRCVDDVFALLPGGSGDSHPTHGSLSAEGDTATSRFKKFHIGSSSFNSRLEARTSPQAPSSTVSFVFQSAKDGPRAREGWFRNLVSLGRVSGQRMLFAKTALAPEQLATFTTFAELVASAAAAVSERALQSPLFGPAAAPLLATSAPNRLLEAFAIQVDDSASASVSVAPLVAALGSPEDVAALFQDISARPGPQRRISGALLAVLHSRLSSAERRFPDVESAVADLRRRLAEDGIRDFLASNAPIDSEAIFSVSSSLIALDSMAFPVSPQMNRDLEAALAGREFSADSFCFSTIGPLKTLVEHFGEAPTERRDAFVTKLASGVASTVPYWDMSRVSFFVDDPLLLFPAVMSGWVSLAFLCHIGFLSKSAASAASIAAAVCAEQRRAGHIIWHLALPILISTPTTTTNASATASQILDGGDSSADLDFRRSAFGLSLFMASQRTSLLSFHVLHLFYHCHGKCIRADPSVYCAYLACALRTGVVDEETTREITRMRVFAVEQIRMLTRKSLNLTIAASAGDYTDLHGFFALVFTAHYTSVDEWVMATSEFPQKVEVNLGALLSGIALTPATLSSIFSNLDDNLPFALATFAAVLRRFGPPQQGCILATIRAESLRNRKIPACRPELGNFNNLTAIRSSITRARPPNHLIPHIRRLRAVILRHPSAAIRLSQMNPLDFSPAIPEQEYDLRFAIYSSSAALHRDEKRSSAILKAARGSQSAWAHINFSDVATAPFEVVLPLLERWWTAHAASRLVCRTVFLPLEYPDSPMARSLAWARVAHEICRSEQLLVTAPFDRSQRELVWTLLSDGANLLLASDSPLSIFTTLQSTIAGTLELLPCAFHRGVICQHHLKLATAVGLPPWFSSKQSALLALAGAAPLTYFTGASPAAILSSYQLFFAQPSASATPSHVSPRSPGPVRLLGSSASQLTASEQILVLDAVSRTIADSDAPISKAVRRLFAQHSRLLMDALASGAVDFHTTSTIRASLASICRASTLLGIHVAESDIFLTAAARASIPLESLSPMASAGVQARFIQPQRKEGHCRGDSRPLRVDALQATIDDSS